MAAKMTSKTVKHKAKKPSKANAMWGGQFEQAPDALMSRINASIGFDRKLYAQDIAGSIAHSQMLVRQGIISKTEGEQIRKGLEAILARIESGKFEFKESLEDIHMNIESALAAMTPAAGKLHTARSRNDQVATDFRLYVRGACDGTMSQLQALQRALIERAEQHAGSIMPGFTHLQVAQPVTLGHHLMAYVEMFGRDRSRFADARKRMNESPLGAAALAGTPFPIDRHATAGLLGFTAPMANSLDAVASRDFALEFLSTSAICATHLTRLAEEMILWSSAQFGFIRFSDGFSTGSSIMPQKRNPDAAELVRGKAGRVYGALVALLTVMKALPLAYNKDMQEDKEPVFDAVDTLSLCLQAAAGMVRDFTADTERMNVAAGQGYSTATDLADWLVRTLGMPFRKAHHVTGQIVKLAASRQCGLEDISLKDMQRIESGITKAVFSVLGVENSVKSRTSFGGTSPVRVREAIKAAKAKYL